MKSDKYSSEWIAQHDMKNAADALRCLERAAAKIRGILTNADHLETASECVETAIRFLTRYKPYTPIITNKETEKST